MYNTGLFNSFLYDAKSRISSLIGSTEDVVFNGFGLQNSSIITSNISIETTPDRDFETTKIPNDHGRIINSDFFNSKTIRISGVIYKGTAALFETLIDKIKKNLSAQSGNLDIKRADGNYRRHIVTARTIDIKREKHSDISSAPFEFVFECLTPFGQNVTQESNLFSVSDLVFNENIYNIGSAESKPIWIMIVTSASSITKCNVKNNDTDEEVEFTTGIVAGDVLIVDGKNKTITKNGTAVDYNGNLPKLLAGSNSYTITMTGTSIAYSLTHKYTPFFL